MASRLTSLQVGATSVALATGVALGIVGDSLVTGNQVATGTISGAHLRVVGTGTGKLSINSTANGTGTGGSLCVRDRDDGGYTTCSYLNGTQTCRIAGASECP